MSGRSGRVLFALALGTAGMLAGQLALPPLLPTIIAEFGISSSQAGGALTAMWACAALAMYPGGHLSDRLSRKTVLVASVTVLATGFAVLSVGDVLTSAAGLAFPLFVLSVVVVGVGIGLYEPTSMATVSDLFASRRGRAYGVISSSYNVGSMIAAGLAAAALWIGSWRLAFLPSIAAVALVGVMLHRWSPEPYVVSLPAFELRAVVERLLEADHLPPLLALFCLYSFIWQSSVSFFPTFVQVELGYSPTVANVAYGSIFVVGLLVSPVAGSLGDRFGHRRVGLLAPLLGAVGLAALASGVSPVLSAMAMVAFALGLATFWPVMTADLMSVLSSETLGADYGIARAFFYGIGSLGPTYVGIVADVATYTVAYAGIVVAFLLAFCTLAFLVLSE